MQILSPIFDPLFSEHSYGFRPGRSAGQAVEQAQKYQHEGKNWVVDMDLKSFFDEVNHDLLMARVRRHVKDKAMLKLIRSWLKAGVMVGGLTEATDKGTPQGGPLSPLLSNIMLDDLDKELEKRGHSFCRYADDCNIYIATQRSGERVLASITTYLETKLKLKVNHLKSAVDRPSRRIFLGYSFTGGKHSRIRVPKKTAKKMKSKLKDLFRQGRGAQRAPLHRRHAQSSATRMDELLPPEPDQNLRPRTGRMATPPLAVRDLATMEASPYPLQEADRARAQD